MTAQRPSSEGSDKENAGEQDIHVSHAPDLAQLTASRLHAIGNVPNGNTFNYSSPTVQSELTLATGVPPRPFLDAPAAELELLSTHVRFFLNLVVGFT
jgi:hypothetical protein